MTTEKWSVITEPVGKNPGKVKRTAMKAQGQDPDALENVGGIVVYLVRGASKEEFARAAFRRRVGYYSDRKLTDQVKLLVKEAEEAAEILNRHEAGVLL